MAGRYRLAEQVGRGGMGTVWRAEDIVLGRDIALKQLHVPDHLDDEEVRILHERTRREAHSAARISHPHVIVVHDVVDDGGRPCVVMEYIPSITLAEAIRERGPLPPAEVARIGSAVAAALRAAHGAGVLHRDVKPANVLLGDDGRIVLSDFGIALPSGAPSLTTTGEWVGSIDYIAPERLLGKDGGPGPASDLWSLGAMLYCAVEGSPPFRRDVPIATAHAIVVDELRLPRQAGGVSRVIEGLLVKDPAERMDAETAERLLGKAAGEQNGTIRLPAATAPGSARTATARWRGRRAVMWSLTAAVVVGVAAFTPLLLDGVGDGGRRSASAPSGTAPSHAGATAPAVPVGFRLAEEDGGLALPVPDGWSRTSTYNGEIAYVDPSGLVGLRLSSTRFAEGDALRHWREVEEEQTRQNNPGYERLRMNATTFRGGPAGYWEFTFKGKKRGFRAVELAFADGAGTQHVIYLSAPAAQWSQYRPVFDKVVAGLRLPGEAS